jgi:hypothetical protein
MDPFSAPLQLALVLILFFFFVAIANGKRIATYLLVQYDTLKLTLKLVNKKKYNRKIYCLKNDSWNKDPSFKHFLIMQQLSGILSLEMVQQKQYYAYKNQ